MKFVFCLHEKLSNRVIVKVTRTGLHASDLTPCDFFLWDFVKFQTYEINLPMNDLMEDFRRVIGNYKTVIAY